MKRIVFDTNTTISALFWKGPARKLYDLVKSGVFILLSSVGIERELINRVMKNSLGVIARAVGPKQSPSYDAVFEIVEFTLSVAEGSLRSSQ